MNIKAVNDNARQLGLYIADANHAGEKLLVAWHDGCLADTYDIALAEIEAVQAMNTRTQKGKTYHLIVSFRPEDESKLTPEIYQDIERTIAKTLGFDEHQRLCGVHKNTNNIHLHIAYNMIHPEKFTRNEPFRDYKKLSEACRILEKKHALMIDNGMEQTNPQQIHQRAASMESHAGQESFQTYALKLKTEILETSKTARTWDDFNESLAEYGMAIKPSGNGMALVNLHGKGAMKASSFDRSFSKIRLTAKLGDYVVSVCKNSTPPKQRYSRKPIQHPTKELDKLSETYLSMMKIRDNELGQIEEQGKTSIDEITKKWNGVKIALEKNGMSRAAKNKQRKIIRLQAGQEIVKERNNIAHQKWTVRGSIPFYNWNSFLKWQATQGNENALNILRNRNIDPHQLEQNTGKNLLHYYNASTQSKIEKMRQAQQIIASTRAGKFQRGMLAGNKMEGLAFQEILRDQAGYKFKTQKFFQGYKQTLDNNGIIIFALPGGGSIRDTGKKIYFSPGATTQTAAIIYAQAQYGKNIKLSGNTIERRINYGKQYRSNDSGHRENDRSGNADKSNIGGIKRLCQNGLRVLSKLNVVCFGQRDKMFLPNHAHIDLER